MAYYFLYSSTSFFVGTSANISVIKRDRGWKYIAVVEGYVESSLFNKTGIAEKNLWEKT